MASNASRNFFLSSASSLSATIITIPGFEGSSVILCLHFPRWGAGQQPLSRRILVLFFLDQNKRTYWICALGRFGFMIQINLYLPHHDIHLADLTFLYVIPKIGIQIHRTGQE